MPITTSRLLIVCPPEQRDNVNTALNIIAGASGVGVMHSRLTSPTDPSGPTVAYWASWPMDDATRSQVNAAVRSNDSPWKPPNKLTNVELTVYEPPIGPVWGTQRVYLFNGLTWGLDAVLATLGLSRPEPVDIF